MLLEKHDSSNLPGKTQFTIKSLRINRNKIHFSNSKFVVSNPKCFFIAADNLHVCNDKNKQRHEKRYTIK